ncbi:hypothetical protein AX16_000336 [Volvariella volvacea WC 439]|nr:hypothetical protein AX16_000336 [Volvariella volvacea WC 439]
MLSLFQSRTLQSSWQLSRTCAFRSISVSSLRYSELSPEPPTEAEKAEAAEAAAPEPQPVVSVEEEKSKPETYNQFMKEIGSKFKKAEPRNWLGGKPFPMNPSFKPPPPISDALRSQIYHEYMKNPAKNNVRALSQKYHLSLKRVDAILRLKGMEAAWIKGKELQTGFVTGMEKLLGVKQNEEMKKAWGPDERDWARYDADEADSLEEAEKRDSARLRYERQYFESVPEGNPIPITPTSLEAAKARAKEYAQQAERAKADPVLMPKVPNTATIKTPRSGVQVVTKPGRPALKFVDIGGKFLDVDERLHRIAGGERRARMKLKKQGGMPART